MTKKKPLLLVFILVSVCIIISAIIVAFTAGINLGSEIAGGSQIEVLLPEDASVKELTGKAKTALNENHISYEKIFEEDKNTNKYLVIRTNAKNIEQEALKASLAQNLGVDEANVSDVYAISASITKTNIIWASVTVVLVLLGLFAAFWIRYNLVSATCALLTTLHTLILSASLHIITRLPLTLISLSAIVICVAASLFAYVLFTEKVVENKKLVHNKDLSSEEIVDLSKKETLMPQLFALCLVLVFSVILMFIPARYVLFGAISLFACAILAGYSHYFVGTNLFAFMQGIKDSFEKERLSTNQSSKAKTKK